MVLDQSLCFYTGGRKYFQCKYSIIRYSHVRACATTIRPYLCILFPSECYEHYGIYSALQLENQFHFIQFINRTVVRVTPAHLKTKSTIRREDFKDAVSNFNVHCIYVLQNNHGLAEIFNGVKVDLEGIILLEEEGKDNLINFANAGLGEIDYGAYLSEVTHTKTHTLLLCLFIS